MRRVWAVALVLVPAVAQATVWHRVRGDGAQEFTNVDPKGGGWTLMTSIKETRTVSAPAPQAASEGKQGYAHSATRTMWTRQRRDGTIEFTNLPPVGSNWKVLFRTGPGKAAAVRGATDLVAPRDVSSERFSRFDDHIRDQQAFFGVPQALIRAVIKTESDYDPKVVSSVGATGLMQLMPDTARAMGVTNIWDPRQNIMGGARYLQVLAQRFCRTPSTEGHRNSGIRVCSAEERVKVLAAYHAGPGAVEKYGGWPPYETTRAYVMNVLSRYEEYRRRDSALPGSMLAAR